jgi:hypothetical protein
MVLKSDIVIDSSLINKSKIFIFFDLVRYFTFSLFSFTSVLNPIDTFSALRVVENLSNGGFLDKITFCRIFYVTYCASV